MVTKIKRTLTNEQQAAVKALEDAFELCKQSNVLLHNCYTILKAFNGNVIDTINEDESELSCDNYCKVIKHSFDLESWEDEYHFIHLKNTTIQED